MGLMWKRLKMFYRLFKGDYVSGANIVQMSGHPHTWRLRP